MKGDLISFGGKNGKNDLEGANAKAPESFLSLEPF
jgi:hypothetical protein